MLTARFRAWPQERTILIGHADEMEEKNEVTKTRSTFIAKPGLEITSFESWASTLYKTWSFSLHVHGAMRPITDTVKLPEIPSQRFLQCLRTLRSIAFAPHPPLSTLASDRFSRWEKMKVQSFRSPSVNRSMELPNSPCSHMLAILLQRRNGKWGKLKVHSCLLF